MAAFPGGAWSETRQLVARMKVFTVSFVRPDAMGSGCRYGVRLPFIPPLKWFRRSGHVNAGDVVHLSGVELTGHVFGRLTVLRFAGKQGKSKLWQCRCVCGQAARVRGSSLLSGDTKSCGCLRRERTGVLNVRHGLCKTLEYATWEHIKNRCLNPNAGNYHRYGGRGITIAKGWQDDFEAFLRDIGRCPGKGHSIDRIDNRRGYEPGNVRWATAKEQARNTRRNRIVILDGESVTLAEASERMGVPYNTLWARMNRASTNVVR